MREVFAHWKFIHQALHQAKETLFLFDFDGTLSRIVQHPSAARMSKEVKPLLRKLSKKKGIKVGVISGRSLSDIKKKVGMKDLIYAGNHGFEAEGNDFRFIHPHASSMKSELNQIVSEATSLLRGMKGIHIENKEMTASIHYRNISPFSLRRFLSFMNRFQSRCESRGFFLRAGKKVFEILPELKWNKGMFVRLLEKKFGYPLIVYIGDDTTDEDAFRAIKKRGISIRIGAIKGSAASYFLPLQSDIALFLRRVIES
ncbi:MAG: Trehalose-phosphate phosphatase [Elusimicrobia bacterium]|nr:Trehalose-phosphate phosphatase [Elusimicrobiota bacterium]